MIHTLTVKIPQGDTPEMFKAVGRFRQLFKSANLAIEVPAAKNNEREIIVHYNQTADVFFLAYFLGIEVEHKRKEEVK